MNIRLAEPKDLLGIQACGFHNLPETYGSKYWLTTLVRWPQLSFVAEDQRGKIVGYVFTIIEDLPIIYEPSTQLGKLFDRWHVRPRRPTNYKRIGYVNSISVLRSHRRMGIARKLMNLSIKAVVESYGLREVYLTVRKSNRAARSLYQSLGFVAYDEELRYYNDGETGIHMKVTRKVPPERRSTLPLPEPTQRKSWQSKVIPNFHWKIRITPPKPGLIKRRATTIHSVPG